MNSYRNVADRTRYDDYDADLRQSHRRDEHECVESRHHVAEGTTGGLSREVDRDERTTIAAQPYGNEENDKNETYGNQGDSRTGSESDDEDEHDGRRRIIHKRKITSRFTRSRYRIVRVNRHGLPRNRLAPARTRPRENSQHFSPKCSSTEVSDDEKTSSFSHYLRRTRSRSPRSGGGRGGGRLRRSGKEPEGRWLGGHGFYRSNEELGGRVGKHVRDGLDSGRVGVGRREERHVRGTGTDYSDDDEQFGHEGTSRADSDDERFRHGAERDHLHPLVTEPPLGEDSLDERHTSGTLGTTVTASSSSSLSNGCRSERERESDSAKTNDSSTGKSLVSANAEVSPLKSDTKLSKKRSVSVKNKEFGFDFGIDGWKALLQGKIKMNWTYRRQTSCIEESNEISGKADEILQSMLALQKQQQAVSSVEAIVVEPDG